MENLKTFEQFLQDVEEKEELANSMKIMLEGNDIKNLKFKIDEIVKFAKEKGYDVSVEDFSKLNANQKELDENELALATGGKKSCSWDYLCVLLWNTCNCSNECKHSGHCENLIKG